MMAPASLRSLAPALLAALVLSGCGENRGAGPAAATTPVPLLPAGARTIEVSLTEYRLTPTIARVARSGMITIQVANDGDVRHALAVEGPIGDVRTRALRPGERETIHVRLAPGSYKWYCPLANHEQLGMTGAVAVAEPR